MEGHVFDAVALCIEHDQQHVIDAQGIECLRSPENTDYLLASCFEHLENTPSAHRGKAFNEMIRTAFDPACVEDTHQRLAERNELADKFSKKLVCLHHMLVEDGAEKAWSLEPEPKGVHKALDNGNPERLKWKEAMDEEINSMIKYGVFRAVPASQAHGEQLLRCHWIYKRKVDSSGQVCRYRSRLVAGGHLQKPFEESGYGSYDLESISSPIVSKGGLRVFLSMCAGLHYKVRQLDVSAAFLQTGLQEEIYVKAPRGFEGHVGEDQVMLVKRGLYGLKQGSASWHKAIRQYLIGTREEQPPSERTASEDVNDHIQTGGFPADSGETLRGLGFKSLISDPCLFERTDKDGGRVLVALYVDDITFAASSDRSLSSETILSP